MVFADSPRQRQHAPCALLALREHHGGNHHGGEEVHQQQADAARLPGDPLRTAARIGGGTLDQFVCAGSAQAGPHLGHALAHQRQRGDPGRRWRQLEMRGHPAPAHQRVGVVDDGVDRQHQRHDEHRQHQQRHHRDRQAAAAACP
jgi:hypothetical protein